MWLKPTARGAPAEPLQGCFRWLSWWYRWVSALGMSNAHSAGRYIVTRRTPPGLPAELHLDFPKSLAPVESTTAGRSRGLCINRPERDESMEDSLKLINDAQREALAKIVVRRFDHRIEVAQQTIDEITL